jgi:hypothetical protein
MGIGSKEIFSRFIVRKFGNAVWHHIWMLFQLAACNNFCCVAMSLLIGLPSDSKHSSVRFISYRNDRNWEENLSQVLYRKRGPLLGFWTVAFFVSNYRWISFIETSVPKITSHTESIHDASLTRCCSLIKLSLRTTWACKDSLARNCQRTAYVEVLYR